MRIFLLYGEERRTLRVPYPDADHAVVDGTCPVCGSGDFKVSGRNQRPSSDDRAWEADAVALCCRASVGTIRAEPDTIFGVREDEAVLRGRVRVY